MPYFKLFDFFYLHVPKTGGTSIEDYFYSKLGTMFRQRDEYTMYGLYLDKTKEIRVPNERSLHHFTYLEILQNSKYLDKVFTKTEKEVTTGMDVVRQVNDLSALPAVLNLHRCKYKVISVRNPFDRILSELFWRKGITDTSTKEEVEEKIRHYLQTGTKSNTDNHITPQYQFLLDESGNPISNIHIIRTETLTEDMRALSFKDFNMFRNKTMSDKINYRELLNENAVKMICDYYADDFAYFGYSTDANV